MKPDSSVDLLKLMRRAAVAPDAGEIVDSLSNSRRSSTRNSQTGDCFPVTPNVELLADLAFLVGSPDARGRGSSGLDANHRAQTLEQLDRLLPLLPEHDTAFIAAIDDYLFETLQKVAPETAPLLIERSGIPDELPLLNKVGEEFGKLVDLGNCVLVAVQHLLGSSVPVFSWLNRLGLPYNRMHILGKVYSANCLVVSRLAQLGAQVYPGSLEYPEQGMYNGKRNYELQLTVQIAEALRAALNDLSESGSAKSCLLVLDDGGLIVDILATQFAGEAKSVLAVEQTRKGVEQIRKKAWNFPIVNVAESDSKLHLESPLIGESIVEHIAGRLRRIHGSDNLSLRAPLVVGYGSVGSAVAMRLREYGAREIIVFDPGVEKADNARRAKFKVVDKLEDGLCQSNLVVGCTGKSSLPPGFESYLPHDAVLASGSTSDLEFQEISLRSDNCVQWYEHLATNWSSDHLRVHSDYRMNGPEGQFWLLNGGFPINFDGSVDPIVPSHIQLTRALMLAAVCQLASSRGERGLVKLAKKYDHYVGKRYQRFTDRSV